MQKTFLFVLHVKGLSSCIAGMPDCMSMFMRELRGAKHTSSTSAPKQLRLSPFHQQLYPPSCNITQMTDATKTASHMHRSDDHMG